MSIKHYLKWNFFTAIASLGPFEMKYFEDHDCHQYLDFIEWSHYIGSHCSWMNSSNVQQIFNLSNCALTKLSYFALFDGITTIYIHSHLTGYSKCALCLIHAFLTTHIFLYLSISFLRLYNSLPFVRVDWGFPSACIEMSNIK